MYIYIYILPYWGRPAAAPAPAKALGAGARDAPWPAL